MKKYDLITIGSGIASVPARKAAAAGWKVALIDNQPPGGTCALRGCSPKKMLRSGAEVVNFIRRMRGRGVDVAEVKKSWKDLQDFKDSYTKPIPENNKKIYEKQGIYFIAGTATFTGPNQLCVVSDKEQFDLEADKIALATGAIPRPLSFPGNEFVRSSDDFLEMDELPASICFLGGGFISMEFAHIATEFGSRCTVVQRSERILKEFDPVLIDRLTGVSRNELGIDIHTMSPTVEVLKEKDGKLFVNVERKGGGIERLGPFDAVFHGAGRIANVESLNPAKGNVEVDKGGIVVNEYLQSQSNPSVYAAGDCASTGTPHLSFVASREGVAIASNILNGNETKVNYAGTASVCFTQPTIARAGKLESELQREGVEYEVKEGDSTRWFTHRRTNEQPGGYRVFVEPATDQILGAHLLGHHGDEFINIFALAIHQGITRSELKQVLWAHPSAASDLSRMIG